MRFIPWSEQSTEAKRAGFITLGLIFLILFLEFIYLSLDFPILLFTLIPIIIPLFYFGRKNWRLTIIKDEKNGTES